MLSSSSSRALFRRSATSCFFRSILSSGSDRVELLRRGAITSSRLLLRFFLRWYRALTDRESNSSKSFLLSFLLARRDDLLFCNLRRRLSSFCCAEIPKSSESLGPFAEWTDAASLLCGAAHMGFFSLSLLLLLLLLL